MLIDRRRGHIHFDFSTRDLGLCILDRALERSRIGLLERSAVPQASGPIKRALGQGLIAIMQRVYTQAKNLEGAGGLLGAANTAVDAVKALLELGNAGGKAAHALVRASEPNLGVGEL